MKKRILRTILFSSCCLIMACNAATPETYFGLAVLNSNALVGFAGNGLERELDQPSAKMVNNDPNQSIPMTRKEIIDGKIQWLEEQLGKVKGLKETETTIEMLQTSITMQELVLSGYKGEYQQLARLYDDAAPQPAIDSLSKMIRSKYYSRYDELYKKLIAVGKSYAAENNIKVNWAD